MRTVFVIAGAAVLLVLSMCCAVAAQDAVKDLPSQVDFAELIRTGPKKVKGLKVGDQSPNELPGFEFFRLGKLNGIRLGVSGRDDVRRVFGDACENTPCEYDSIWRLIVNYYEAENPVIGSRDEGATVRAAGINFIGKVRGIRLLPRTRMFFLDSVFSDEFYRSKLSAFGHNFGGSAVHTTHTVYSDGYGLQYIAFAEETFNSGKQKSDREEGQLTEIKYRIPNDLEMELVYTREIINK